MKIKEKCIKSSYIFKNKMNFIEMSTLVISLFLILLASLTQNATCFLVTMSGIFLLYLIIKYFWILSLAKTNHCTFTEYTTELLMKFRVLLCICTVLEIIVSVLGLINGKLLGWQWYTPLMLIMYADSVYLSSIVAFGDNEFISGKYIINYGSITNIIFIEEKNTSAGKMCLVELYNKNGIIGFDKLFIDEYHNLRLKVFKENKYLHQNRMNSAEEISD